MRRIIAGTVAALLTAAALRTLPAQIQEEDDGLLRRFMLACNADGSWWCGVSCESPYCCK